jgi:hypothetical protein
MVRVVILNAYGGLDIIGIKRRWCLVGLVRLFDYIHKIEKTRKALKFYIITILFVLYGCNAAPKEEGHQISDEDTSHVITQLLEPQVMDTITGDFDGNGEREQMWLSAPRLKQDEPDCFGPCVCFIHFSDTSIPSIEVESCIGGVPINQGDLNKNGTEEIGLLPDWFSSCWRGYYVWTLLNGKWERAVPTISTHCYQWEKGVVPIESDTAKDEYVITRHTELTEEDFIIVEESIPIKH